MIGHQTRIVKNEHRAFGNRLVADVLAIQDEAGGVQESVQKQLCPVSEKEHKHLVETIEKKTEGDVTKVTEGGPEHEYWQHVEFGTDDQIEQPHIRPAFAHAVQHKNRRLSELRGKYR